MTTTEFNQLVIQVREALQSGAQGVGEVEVVTSLANIVSLPALRLTGAQESVVEAPLALLSAPAAEAAAAARKATDDAIVAAVNAEAAASVSQAARIGLEDVTKNTVTAGNTAGTKAGLADIAASCANDATLHAMQTAALLQGKLEEAQVIILSGESGQEILDGLNKKVQGSLVISVATRDEAIATVALLKDTQKQLAQAIVESYKSLDHMKLATVQAELASTLATRAVAKMDELEQQVSQAIIESGYQTGQSSLVTIRLEYIEKDLLISQSAADTAASSAHENAALSCKVKDETEQVKRHAIEATGKSIEVTGKAEQAISDILETIAAAKSAASLAREKAGKADNSAEDALYSQATADTAATRALVAEQRALNAAKSAENIVSGVRPDWMIADKTNPNYIANKPEIPTISAEPAPDTLAYTNKDGKLVPYSIGDELRVVVGEDIDFYKLYAINAGKAVWDLSGGASIKQNIYLTGADHNTANVIKQGILI